jgi:hypothetical protein
MRLVHGARCTVHGADTYNATAVIHLNSARNELQLMCTVAT